MKLESFELIVTAPGRNTDFVSRFFATGTGIPEDPVTGSSHCTLTPDWSDRLDKKKLHAPHLSKRGGEMFCENLATGWQSENAASPILLKPLRYEFSIQ